MPFAGASSAAVLEDDEPRRLRRAGADAENAAHAELRAAASRPALRIRGRRPPPAPALARRSLAGGSSFAGSFAMSRVWFAACRHDPPALDAPPDRFELRLVGLDDRERFRAPSGRPRSSCPCSGGSGSAPITAPSAIACAQALGVESGDAGAVQDRRDARRAGRRAPGAATCP